MVYLLSNSNELKPNSLSAVSCMLLIGKPEDWGVSLDILKLAAAVTWHSSWTTASHHQSSNITALGTGPDSAASQTDSNKTQKESLLCDRIQKSRQIAGS